MKQTLKTLLNRSAFFALMAGATACSQQAVKSVDHCTLNPNSNVDRMFSQVSDKLADSSCHYVYPEYREQLVAAAKGAPGPDNEARFATLLRESIDRGIISKRQGQAVFSQYFDPEFFAVKAEPRSSCSSLRHKERMYASMREELSYKREGMLEMLEDEDRFREAQQHYNNLQLVFDAVEVACTQEL
jgi:hypothetical protein